MARGDVMFAATGVTTGADAARRAPHGGRRDDAFHRHAQQVRHRPLRRGAPQFRPQARGLHRLTRHGAGAGADGCRPAAGGRARRRPQRDRPALGLAARPMRASAMAIAQRAELPELVGRLLAARGVGIDAVADFLEPTLRVLLPDPSDAARHGCRRGPAGERGAGGRDRRGLRRLRRGRRVFRRADGARAAPARLHRQPLRPAPADRGLRAERQCDPARSASAARR